MLCYPCQDSGLLPSISLRLQQSFLVNVSVSVFMAKCPDDWSLHCVITA